MAAAAEQKIPLVEMERELFGFDHGELGGSILERWGFPRELSDLVRLHHAPVDETHSFPAAALSVADTLARLGGKGSQLREEVRQEIQRYLASLN